MRKADVYGLTKECRKFLIGETAALPPEPAVKVTLTKGAANDPKGTLSDLNMRSDYGSYIRSPVAAKTACGK